MMNLNQLLSRHSAQSLPPRGLIILFAITALIGFIDATYLTVIHFLGEAPSCSILNGCEAVTTSNYATLWFIPISLVGSVYYLFVFLLAVAALDMGKKTPLAIAIYMTWGGFAASLVLVSLQFFVIKALCLYCMLSAITTLVLFVLGIFLLQYKKAV